jgi:L-aspartate oxidase
MLDSEHMLSTQRRKPRRVDLLVVGSGVAGLTAALEAADAGAEVQVISKGPVLSSNSYFAQGGVAAALADDDSPTLHAEDTFRAGRGLSAEGAVSVLVEEAPPRIADLVRLGVQFDDGLGREGGHSRRRVVHAGGADTGRKIAEVLARRVLDHPGVAVTEGERVISLWQDGDGRCVGALTEHRAVAARATLLATGGYAALWARTTNPPGALGQGIAMAYRAGASVADLEFVQFHPTALLDDGFLLSEALRGEGALLVDDRGERFTDELAPRDVVARAIAERGVARLDLRAIDRGHFPSLMATLERVGYDPAVEPIPVSPAAHYSMGGVVTDTDARTTVRGLYAAGEVACTGVHGANRLASNSLLECLVFGRRAALASRAESELPGRLPPPARPLVEPEPDSSVREALWEHAGLLRSADGLAALQSSPSLLARLIAGSALIRTESRGGHFRVDFPFEDESLERHVVLQRHAEPELQTWR